jgi:hypothetical protein
MSTAMQQHVPTHNRKQRLFTASEVAEFEYCPLAWWHEQFEPLAQVDTEELFAHLVELEHEHGSDAPTVPEYRMVEQLLVRKGAFDEGREQHQEHAEEVAEAEEERIMIESTASNARLLVWLAIALLVIAVLFIAIALLLH